MPLLVDPLLPSYAAHQPHLSVLYYCHCRHILIQTNGQLTHKEMAALQKVSELIACTWGEVPHLEEHMLAHCTHQNMAGYTSR